MRVSGRRSITMPESQLMMVDNRELPTICQYVLLMVNLFYFQPSINDGLLMVSSLKHHGVQTRWRMTGVRSYDAEVRYSMHSTRVFEVCVDPSPTISDVL